MINPKQTNLVLSLVKKELHNLEQLITRENSKPLKDQNIKQTEELSSVYHEYVDIVEELEKAAC